MKICIFGGSGFIGTNVALEATKRKHQVIIMDSLARIGSEENLYIANATYIRGDIRNQEDFERLPKNIDAIINLAANSGVPWSFSYPLYDFKINALGALHVLEYARNNGKIPIIFASTNKIYSDKLNEIAIKEKSTRYIWTDKKYVGVQESFPMDGVGIYSHSPYGASKCAADLYHQEYYHAYHIPTVINRMSCIFGYYQKGVADQGWIDHFIKTITLGDGKIDIFGNGKQVRDMLWAEDVAKLYLDELEQIDSIKGQVFNIGGGTQNTLSLLEAIRIIERYTGKKAKVSFKDWRPADQKIYISDIQKVNKFLHWKPTVSPEEGIKRMIKRLNEHSV